LREFSLALAMPPQFEFDSSGETLQKLAMSHFLLLEAQLQYPFTETICIYVRQSLPDAMHVGYMNF
jgi:hypothetical protein